MYIWNMNVFLIEISFLSLLKSEDFQTLASSFLELQQKWGSQTGWGRGTKGGFGYRMLAVPKIPSCTKWEGCCGFKLQSNLWKWVLSPASLVFQTWGALLSCLLFFYLWNLLQKNLQWYDIVDSNYSLPQGFPFLCFHSGDGETLWIFLCINRRLG